ncbi:MAG: hypothetical protein QGI45_09650 [Myxococcota bacterium]|nr:hypothetical protein [Myxococcota bacterium]
MYSLYFILLLMGAQTAVLEEASPDLSAFVGDYELLSRQDDKSRRQAAIEAGAQQFNFLIRPIARARIEKSCFVLSRLSFREKDGVLTLNSERNMPLTSRIDGNPVDARTHEGEAIKFWRLWNEDNSFVQIIQSERGKRRARMSLNADGSILTIEVQILSDKLDGPLDYVSHYRRR